MNLPKDRPSRVRPVVFGMLALAGVISLHLLAQHWGYLLFHSVVEAFAAGIAAGIFMFAWNSRDYASNGYFLCLGISFLFVGGLDVLHTLAYKGMGVFSSDPELAGSNLATQLWTAARYLHASTFLLAFFYLNKRVRALRLTIAFASISAILVLAIAVWKIFPTCYIEGTGLTPFKRISEYVICGLFVVSLGLLIHHRHRFDREMFWLVIGSLVIMILGEFSFTRYNDPYSTWNEVGHFLKLASYYLLYKAIINISLKRPYAALFRDLKASEKRLREANGELEAYAHSVSHDLKGPLTAAMTTAEAMKRLVNHGQLDPTKLVSMADTISRRVQGMADLINELLKLAEAGQTPSEVAEVSLTQTAKKVLAERAAQLQEKNVQVALDDDLGTLRASSTQVYQIFSNLIGNAIVHNTNPLPSIEIRRLAPAHPEECRFLVRDNGPGIPLELMDKLFAPFTKGPTGGHGLGLSLVDKLVRTYRGKLFAYNDAGACFELTLRPLRD